MMKRLPLRIRLLRQRLGAIPQVVQVRHPQQAHPYVRLGIVLVPVRLVADERDPLVVDLGVHAEDLVAGEDEDVGVVRVLLDSVLASTGGKMEAG